LFLLIKRNSFCVFLNIKREKRRLVIIVLFSWSLIAHSILLGCTWDSLLSNRVVLQFFGADFNQGHQMNYILLISHLPSHTILDARYGSSLPLSLAQFHWIFFKGVEFHKLSPLSVICTELYFWSFGKALLVPTI
jgi:hypothetical protein